MGFNGFIRSAAAGLIALMALLAVSATAEARLAGGLGTGLRGLLVPGLTRGASRAVHPLHRNAGARQGATSNHGPTITTRTANRPGVIGGLAAGFLGAGLFGMLFGAGFFSGLGSTAAVVGLVLQIVLFAVVARWIWGWWQRRAPPAFAGLSPRQLADAYDRPRHDLGSAAVPLDAVAIGEADYDTFERLLADIQTAYGREDLTAIRSRVTPDMLSRLSDELARNASRGLHQVITNVRLLQGDLAEAWREPDAEHAAVLLHYAMVRHTVDRATERVVEGDARRPTQTTELWTFTRSPGGTWKLADIEPA